MAWSDDFVCFINRYSNTVRHCLSVIVQIMVVYTVVLCTSLLLGDFKRRDHLGYVGIFGRIILTLSDTQS